jgi:hypothetical protein
MVKRGYVGMAKGIQQVLWERGLWVEGMVMSLTDKAKSKILVAHKALPQEHLLADKVLAACPDFMEEKSALADLIESRGHILLLSVKCHPEMAGCGIEFCWGMSKRLFRKNNQIGKLQTKDLQLKIEASLSKEVVSLKNVWEFERRTRTYMRMYRDIGLGESTDKLSYKGLEDQMKIYKWHRNIEETESQFLKNFM